MQKTLQVVDEYHWMVAGVFLAMNYIWGMFTPSNFMNIHKSLLLSLVYFKNYLVIVCSFKFLENPILWVKPILSWIQFSLWSFDSVEFQVLLMTWQGFTGFQEIKEKLRSIEISFVSGINSFMSRGEGGNGTTFLVTSITHYFNHSFVKYRCPKIFDIVENFQILIVSFY